MELAMRNRKSFNWYLVDDGLILNGYVSKPQADDANERLWQTCSVVNKKTLKEDFELDPDFDKNWVY